MVSETLYKVPIWEAGHSDRLTTQDFLALARTIGQLAQRLAERVQTLRLPTFAGQSEAAMVAQDRVIALVVQRCGVFGEAIA